MNNPETLGAAGFLAHIKQEGARLLPHDLATHLNEVSRLATGFSAEQGASSWAALAGIWHDLGRYRAGFQRYIQHSNDPDAHIEGRVPGAEKTHSAAGALWAQHYLAEKDPRSGPVIARILSYLIAGHHAGLDDWTGRLDERFNRPSTQKEHSDTQAAAIPSAILRPALPLPDLSTIRSDQPGGIPGRFALWLRMLFSSLVDADFLDTEAFMSPDKAQARKGFIPLAEMEEKLNAYCTRIAENAAARGEAGSTVNQKRAEVLAACRSKAALPPGVFSLTVPTGGGKTLSSLAFALRHAVQHGKHRVIYAIPYTSIIEQTADIFRQIAGDENVLEHHSNIEVSDTKETLRTRLCSENWAAPLIVTTNVQLLESLFARRTSRCRKLHNLAGSVIVLDEAQLLPVAYLQPVVDALNLLVQDYGVTLLLCTATQPSLECRSSFDQATQLRGFKANEVHEIIADVPALYRTLNRVQVHRPASLEKPCTWPELATQIAAHHAALVIVNRRQDARQLYQELKREDPAGVWHLSGLMCAHHRRDTLAAIKNALVQRQQALASGQTATAVRLVSTQLIEAGVDIDFPVVYRALAGLDSIAQAAGRCNREGRLPQGDVHVFIPPKEPPPGLLRIAAGVTRRIWNARPDGEALDVALFAEYFRLLYADSPLDAKGICQLLRAGLKAEVNFRTAAERFKLIDEKDGATVFVRYSRSGSHESIDALIGCLKNEGPQRWLLQKLQGYGVSIYRHDLERLCQLGDIEPLGADCPGLYVQSARTTIFYDKILGANLDGAPGDPESLVY